MKIALARFGVSKNAKLCFAISVLGLFSSISISHADEGGSGNGPVAFVIFPERQQERRQSRWTLTDWMKTRKSIDQQNFWLATHTNKVPVDLTYGFDVKAGGRVGHELDVYVLGFGIRARYEDARNFIKDTFKFPVSQPNPENKSGEFDLQFRIFGGNIQNTSLIARFSYEYDHVYGLGLPFTGPYSGYGIGPELQIYLAQWLGLRGFYRYRFSRENIGNRDVSLKGPSWEALAFLEEASVRFEFGFQSRQWQFERSSAQLASFVNSSLFGRLRVFL